MPPWGAVKGFGAFRDDQSLTPEQLELIVDWEEGGAPEGEPKDLPPPFSVSTPPVLAPSYRSGRDQRRHQTFTCADAGGNMASEDS